MNSGKGSQNGKRIQGAQVILVRVKTPKPKMQLNQDSTKKDESGREPMNRFALFLSMGILIAVFLIPESVHAQVPATNAVTSEIEQPIRGCEQQVASWLREAHIEIAFIVAVIVFGVVISTLQGSKTGWAKRVTVLLAVGTAILTGINSRVFTADDRTLRRAAFEGNAIIGQMWILVDSMNREPLTPQDRQVVAGKYLQKLLEFKSIGEQLNGAITKLGGQTESTERDFGALPRVYAHSSKPEVVPLTKSLPNWVQEPPTDNVSLYFVGRSNAKSLSDAKQKSVDAALNNALVRLKPQASKAADADLLALIKASAIVQDSAFAYDAITGQYTYYTLLRLSKEIQSVGVLSLLSVSTAQAMPVRFQKTGWQPADLTSNPSSGMFVLDTAGGVSRLVSDDKQSPRIEELFRLNSADSGYAVTASADAVFVASQSKLGCVVYRYSFTARVVTRRIMAASDRCVGITTNGSVLYLSMPDRNEIRYWDSWDATAFHSWPLAESARPGYLVFDDTGNRLIAENSSGMAYAIAISDGKQQPLASNLGYVQSIATSRLHILFASGKKVLFVARSDNHGENPPDGLRSLTGGLIVGVTVDANGRLWFADHDNKLVEGPFPLN